MSNNYSETQFESIQTTVDGWYEAFVKSPAFARLSDSHQRKAGAITEFFAQYTYDYLGLAPSEWDSDAVAECCTEVLPRKVSAAIPFFEALAPVLSAFFSFLADQSLLPNGRALAESVEDVADEIVANAQDRSNWGPAKHLVMAAHDVGVDIGDPAALEAFMLQFNLQQAARAFRAETEKANATQAKEQEVHPPSGVYNPCPCGSGKKYKFCCKPHG